MLERFVCSLIGPKSLAQTQSTQRLQSYPRDKPLLSTYLDNRFNSTGTSDLMLA